MMRDEAMRAIQSALWETEKHATALAQRALPLRYALEAAETLQHAPCATSVEAERREEILQCKIAELWAERDALRANLNAALDRIVAMKREARR